MSSQHLLPFRVLLVLAVAFALGPPLAAQVVSWDFDTTGPKFSDDLTQFFDFLGHDPTSGPGANWEITPNTADPLGTDALRTNSNGEVLQHFFSRVALLKVSHLEARNVEFECTVTWDDNDWAGLYVRFQGDSNDPFENDYYYLKIKASGQDDFILHRVKGGVEEQIATGGPIVAQGETHTVKIRAVDDGAIVSIFVEFDGQPVFSMDPAIDDLDPILGCGQVGVGQQTNPGWYDDFKITNMDVQACPCTAKRTISARRYQPQEKVNVTVAVRNLQGATQLVETFPQGWNVSANPNNGVVAGNTITFDLNADGEVSYELTVPDGFCQEISLSGKIMGAGVCAGDVTGQSDLRCSTSVYENEVFKDDPFGYWRLGEAADFIAENIGSALNLIEGTYSGNVMLGEGGLLFGDPDTAVGFDGFDSEVQIPDSDLINTGGPYPARTIELWFQATPLMDVDPRDPRMLYEEGGATRGLNMYVQEVEGQKLIFMTGWNRAQESWDPVVVSTAIQEGTIYHAVLVFDASEDDVFGNFDGRITGYLDGVEFATAKGADQLYAHGDDIGIGGIHQNTLFPDLTNPGDGANFSGIIDEVALYDFPLDDPNDDNDRSDSRVLAHFAAGSNLACPRQLTAARDGANVKLTWKPGGTAPTSVRVVRSGTELAAAAPADPPQYVDTTAAPGVLVYELTFAVPGEMCRSLSAQYNGCISGLTATSTFGKVELAWANNFPYTNIVVRRNDQVLATIGGDQVSYEDTNPPPGLWTYSVVPENGNCGRTSVGVQVFGEEYPQLVLQDAADGYWRLDEQVDFVAVNSGAVGPAIDGTYTGLVVLGHPSLLPKVPDNTAILLEGFDGQVDIPDSRFINTGGPFVARTIELWFQADLIDFEPHTLYEEGGATRGLHIYVQEDLGEKFLFMAGWNLAEERWGIIALSAVIEEAKAYHAVMVFVASEDDVFGNFDGRITGYLNGDEFDTQLGADRLYGHSNNNAIGGVAGNTLLADGSRGGINFVGGIDEVALYNLALDDPNGDGDLGDSRVRDHFLAGAGMVDGKPKFVRGDTDSNGKIELTDGIVTLTFLFVDSNTKPVCFDAADTDDDGTLSITDGIRTFQWLFVDPTQIPLPPSPRPGLAVYEKQDCEQDPTAEDPELGCVTLAQTCQ